MKKKPLTIEEILVAYKIGKITLEETIIILKSIKE